ncbi:hypothetical protein TARUN_1792, partial [Trichoderma arundinaceum]
MASKEAAEKSISEHLTDWG